MAILKINSYPSLLEITRFISCFFIKTNTLYQIDKKILTPLRDLLNSMLDKEGNNLEVSYMDAGEHSITINIAEKEKVLKK